MAISAQGIRAGRAYVEISSDNRGLVRGVKGANRSLMGLGNTVTGLTRQFGVLGGVAGALQLGKLIVGSAEGFNQSMAKSTAIMSGVTSELRKDLKRTAEQVGKDTVFAANEAAEAYFFLASAGLDAQQSLQAMPQVAQFAQAGMFDLALATDLLTDAQSALGLSVKDASQNLKNMQRVSDVLVKANTLANASVEQFSKSLTTQAAAAARTVGKDIEETVAVLAAFADQGTKGEEAGTKFAIVLRDLQTKALANKEAFEAANVAVFDSSGEMRNLADILQDLERKLAGASDATKKQTLLTLGFSDKSVSALQALIGLSEKVRGYETELRNASGTTEKIAEKSVPELTKQWNRLKGEGEQLANTLGEAVIPALTEAVSVVNEVAGAANTAAIEVGKLGEAFAGTSERSLEKDLINATKEALSLENALKSIPGIEQLSSLRDSLNGLGDFFSERKIRADRLAEDEKRRREEVVEEELTLERGGPPQADGRVKDPGPAGKGLGELVKDEDAGKELAETFKSTIDDLLKQQRDVGVSSEVARLNDLSLQGLSGERLLAVAQLQLQIAQAREKFEQETQANTPRDLLGSASRGSEAAFQAFVDANRQAEDAERQIATNTQKTIQELQNVVRELQEANQLLANDVVEEVDF